MRIYPAKKGKVQLVAGAWPDLMLLAASAGYMRLLTVSREIMGAC